MIRIGLLSDTHGTILPRILTFFDSCDEIWHAGDIGNTEAAAILSSHKKLRAVYGNIDGTELRLQYPLFQLFEIEKVKVLMTHIGGYPGHYEKTAKEMIVREKPTIFISGHSHILKVIYDNKYNLLHINPGAAGKSGLHHVITAVRFKIHEKEIKNLEVFEIERK
jgi:hypothetical protein